MKLFELLADMPVSTVRGDTDVDITGISKDSREAKEGYIFFATKASKIYIEDVLRKGARAIVSDTDPGIALPCLIITKDVRALLGAMASKFYNFPSRKFTVIGITGTNGKTTTGYLIESIIKAANKKTAIIGTISHRYNGRVLKAKNTTPGAVELQALLKDIHDAQCEYVIMEVSSHALDQRRVEGIDFDYAIFTNLTHDHLDYHGNIEHYLEAKKLFFTYYLPKSTKKEKYALLNLDDPVSQDFIPDKPVKTFFYSINKKADAYLTDFREDINGLHLELSLFGTRLILHSPLIGMFNASNILASSLVSHLLGISHDEIKRGVEALNGVPGRLERIMHDSGLMVFIDYAHTPDALAKVLEMLNRIKKGKLILIFGCGGDRDRAKRPVMGNIASRFADLTIITSDNPRSENPQRIIEDIQRGFRGNSFRIIPDRREAIIEGIRNARENDILLIAGKGHEDYQIIGNNVIHFSDREVVEEALHVAHK